MDEDKLAAIKLHLDTITKGDERSIRLLWLVGLCVITILLLCVWLYITKHIESFGLEQLGVLSGLVAFLLGMVVFVFIANDRLHHCTKQCVIVKMFLEMEAYDRVSSIIDTLCADKLSMKEMKDLIPISILPGARNG